jgi:hypothetical protein
MGGLYDFRHSLHHICLEIRFRRIDSYYSFAHGIITVRGTESLELIDTAVENVKELGIISANPKNSSVILEVRELLVLGFVTLVLVGVLLWLENEVST